MLADVVKVFLLEKPSSPDRDKNYSWYIGQLYPPTHNGTSWVSLQLVVGGAEYPAALWWEEPAASAGVGLSS